MQDAQSGAWRAVPSAMDPETVGTAYRHCAPAIAEAAFVRRLPTDAGSQELEQQCSNYLFLCHIPPRCSCYVYLFHHSLQ